jgi:hypothetical protein
MPADELHYRLALPRGRHSLRHDRASNQWTEPLSPQLPRVTRLMALAIRFEGLLTQHPELSYTDLARLSGVCRSRITEILNLLHLAPDLQERLLFLEPNPHGRDQIHEPALRRLSQIYDWNEQRHQFEGIFSAAKLDA